MRESGFYWIKRNDDHSRWEVAEWRSQDSCWSFAGNLGWIPMAVYSVDENRIPTPDETPPEITPPAEQPVTLEEVVRVLRAYRLEDPAINRAVLTIHPDGRGYIDASAGQPFAAEWSDVAHLSRIIRAALANLDAPPKPSTFDAMRGVE